MKKLIPLFLLLSFKISAETASCTVELFSKIYRLESNQALSSDDIVHVSNCDSVVLNKVSQLISNSNGAIGADFIKAEIEKDFHEFSVNIMPRKLSLLELNSTLRDQLTSGSNLYFLNSKSLNGLRSLGLVEGEQLKASCESCNTYGEKNIKLDITSPLANTSRTLWFSSRIMAKIKVFKAKRNLSFQQKNLEANDFYADDIYSGSPDNLITTLDNIHFYKANRMILQGAAVSNLDIQPVNLINYGTPVNVILKNQNISLQRTAMPSRSALFGETIELKNPNNNKMIAGKVVDYNKVVIEL
ncbi:MAG: flagellar basal body P-ring formation chaperone FlgA [Bacteriovorax sp.]